MRSEVHGRHTNIRPRCRSRCVPLYLELYLANDFCAGRFEPTGFRLSKMERMLDGAGSVSNTSRGGVKHGTAL